MTIEEQGKAVDILIEYLRGSDWGILADGLKIIPSNWGGGGLQLECRLVYTKHKPPPVTIPGMKA